MVQNKKVLIAYRLFFALICLFGIYLNIIDNSMKSFMGNGTCLNFYTLQSNIWVFVLEVFLIVFNIVEFFYNRNIDNINNQCKYEDKYKKENGIKVIETKSEALIKDEKRNLISFKNNFENIERNSKSKFVKNKNEITRENLIVLKYIVTVAISLTFFVYWSMLAPYMDLTYLLAPSNILVHAVTPIFMMIDYFVFDRDVKLKEKTILLTLIPPIYYLAFALVRAEVSTTTLTAGSRYPYWFIDVDLFGWLGNGNGMGIIYWVFLMMFLVLGLGAMFYKLKYRKSESKIYL